MKAVAKISSIAVSLAIATALTANAAEIKLPTPGKDSKVLFENDHIRFVEVMRWPGEKVTLDALPTTTIIAADAPWPTVNEKALNTKAAASEAKGNRVTGPDGGAYPWCFVQTPLAAREVTVTGNYPQHFYRVEYKRIDGNDLEANWKKWYPWALDPVRETKNLGKTLQEGAPFSNQWRFPFVYMPEIAAPANHYVRFENDHVQLLEVVVRPGEEEHVHGHPYRTVYADDGGFAPKGGAQDYYRLNTKSKIPYGDTGRNPSGEWPICKTSVPSGPHRIINTKGPLNHFYRIQFKHTDGEDIKSQWQTLYPRSFPEPQY